MYLGLSCGLALEPGKWNDATEQVFVKLTEQLHSWHQDQTQWSLTPDPSTNQSAEIRTLTLFITMMNDFFPYIIHPLESHRGARSLSMSYLWLQAWHHVLNKSFHSWLQTPAHVLLGFDAHRQMDLFSTLFVKNHNSLHLHSLINSS